MRSFTCVPGSSWAFLRNVSGDSREKNCFFFLQVPASPKLLPDSFSDFCSEDTKIQQSSGVISSPNFPNNYGASQSCVWTITAPEGYRVQLTIHWFGVEDHRYSPHRPGSCYDDSLIISEAVGSESRQIYKLCGCKGLITSVSSQEKMWLEFSSYKKANWPGFYATYQTLCEYATHF